TFCNFFTRKRSADGSHSPCLSGTESSSCGDSCHYGHCALLTEKWFTRLVSLERKRTERSRVPFLLVLLDIDRLNLINGDRDQVATQVMNALSPLTRETDLIGWFKTSSVIGAMFTALNASLDTNSVVS